MSLPHYIYPLKKAISSLISLIVISIVTTLIIEENEHNISPLKVLG